MFLRYFGYLGFIVSSIFLLDNFVDAAMTMQQMENAANGIRNVCIPKTGADPANGILFTERENGRLHAEYEVEHRGEAETFSTSYEACKRPFSLRAIVAGLRNGNFPEDEKFQCYLKCVMTLIKTMKNGRPLLDPILKQINLMMPAEMQDRNIAAAKTCAALDFNDDACIAAWQFIKCQYETDPEVFFFP